MLPRDRRRLRRRRRRPSPRRRPPAVRSTRTRWRPWWSSAAPPAPRCTAPCCTRTAGSAVSTPPLPARVHRPARRAGTHACDGGRTLVGGSGAVLHLRPRARSLLAATAPWWPATPTPRPVARLLLDRGLADPWWPRPRADDSVDDVTVVVPVRDRPHQLARLLAALPAAARCVVVDDGSLDPGPTRAVAAGVRRPAAAARGQPRPRRRPQHRPGRRPHAVRRVPRLRRGAAAAAGSGCCAGTSTTRPSAWSAPGCSAAARPDDSWLCRYEAARSSLDLGPAPRRCSRWAGWPTCRARRCSPGGRRCSTAPGSTSDCMSPRTSTWCGGCTPPAGGCATSRRPPYATTTGPTLAALAAPQGLLRHRRRAARRPARLRRRAAGAEPVDRRAHRRRARPAALVAPVAALVCVGVDRLGLPQAARRRPAGAHRRVADRPGCRVRAAAGRVRADPALLAGGRCSPPPGPPAPAGPWPSPPSRTRCSTTVACSPTSTRSGSPLARRLDDLAYGTGLWAGAVRARSPRALVPAVPRIPTAGEAPR